MSFAFGAYIGGTNTSCCRVMAVFHGDDRRWLPSIHDQPRSRPLDSPFLKYVSLQPVFILKTLTALPEEAKALSSGTLWDRVQACICGAGVAKPRIVKMSWMAGGKLMQEHQPAMQLQRLRRAKEMPFQGTCRHVSSTITPETSADVQREWFTCRSPATIPGIVILPRCG